MTILEPRLAKCMVSKGLCTRAGVDPGNFWWRGTQNYFYFMSVQSLHHRSTTECSIRLYYFINLTIVFDCFIKDCYVM